MNPAAAPSAHPEVVRLGLEARILSERVNALRKQYPDITEEALEDSAEFKDLVVVLEQLRTRPDVVLFGDPRNGNIVIMASPYNPGKEEDAMDSALAMMSAWIAKQQNLKK